MSHADLSIDEIELPIKRTEGETIEERLTGNAYYNILPARYLQKDADGNVVEDQEELFERVARNIALAEAVYEAENHDRTVTVTPDQLKPDHPRRGELAGQVFGIHSEEYDSPDDLPDDLEAARSHLAVEETELTERNVNKFAYETVVPELPEAVREHVESVADEFQEMMENLSFMPNCVPPDSLVAANGGMKAISEVDPGERVYDDEDGCAEVESKYRNGQKRVVEIATDSGYSVRATLEHYFRVIDEDGEYEWRQVKDLEPGHSLALQKNFLDDDGSAPSLDPVRRVTDGGVTTDSTTTGRPRSRIETPDSVTPEFAEWLGLYVGDGTARKSGVRVAFDEADDDLVTRWCELTAALFGFEPTTRRRNDAACVIGQAHRRDLTEFLDRNDLLKGSSTDATVPEAILGAGRTPIARFLRGLFEADGTVADRTIELYTHSETLGRQVQKLLLGLGIRSSLSEKRDGYRVSIRKNVCGRRFVERVGFISERKRRSADRFRNVSPNATSIKIPNQGERLLEWYRESDLGHDAYRDLSQFLIDFDSDYRQDVGKEIFERYAGEYPELENSPVAEHVDRDQIYEPVSSITELGTMSVEDMQVPRRNTYVVEGFVSHNSPTLMNAGDELQQLSACFVDSPEDDIDDIHQTAKEAAQVFQCLTADTHVSVDGKGLISIADVEPGDEIRQRHGEEYRTRTVAETHAYEEAPVQRVTTEVGIELTGTPNHELLVDGEWTRIDAIEDGDRLSIRLGWLQNDDETVALTSVDTGPQWEATRTVTNGSGGRTKGDVSFDTGRFDELYEADHSDAEIASELGIHSATVGQYRASQSLETNGTPVKSVSQPTTLTPDLAELLGMWVGDGSKHQDGIRFHLRREETLEHADHLCRKLFDEGLDWRFEEGCYDAVLNSHEVKRFWLANFGDAKPDASNASAPEDVLRADRETVAAFLRGLFSTDGSLQDGTYPRLWSASETLIDEVQQLLLGLGSPAKKWETDSEDRDYYNVGPIGELGLRTFANHVGFVDSRQDEMIAGIDGTAFRPISCGEVNGKNTWELPVESIEDAGTATVYDVTVAGNHEYIADSVVSHNSGGGMGYAFWRLRPYGDPVGSTGGIASGPITFMRTYDQMCFPPGTDVLTPGGQRPIESLSEGELVVDEDGDERPVVETMERRVNEELVEITPERLNKPIRATGEHPFRVVRDGEFEWVDARDVVPDDLLVLGHSEESNDLDPESTVNLSRVATGPLVFTDGGMSINREYYGVSKGREPASIADEVPVSDFATIAGWYLAEGCVVYRRGIPNEVTFTLHHDERDAAAEIRDALDSFDAPVRFEPVEDRNTLHIHVESASFAQLIEGLFGTGAAEKAVPELLWRAPAETQARVLESLFAGDGRLEKRGKSQRVQLKLANEEIVDFAFQAGLRCGVQFSRHDRTPEDRKPTYSISASVSTALETPLECLFDEVPDDFSPRDRTKQAEGRDVVAIDEIDRTSYEGPVYNVEVPGTHSYVAEDLVVHNCETIAQGGARRGAQMGVMRVSHPDVVQFIHAKNKDVSLAHTLRLNDPDDYTHTSFTDALEEARELITEDGKVPKHLRNAVEGHLSNFNISVGITDRFMEALENGEDYTFYNPRTEEPHVATEQTEELYDMFGLGEYVEAGEVLSVPAEEIWERIIDGAHENGEPGVIFLDRVNEEHSFPVEVGPAGYEGDHVMLATNPCVTGDTLISTEDGLVPAEELYEQGVARDVVVDGRLSDDTVKEASSVYKTGEKDVYRLTTEEGYELRLTADHRVMTDDGWTEAADLKPGDTVHVQNRKGEFGQHGAAEEGRVLGWLVGDGHLKHGEGRAVLNFYDEDAEVSEQFADDVNEVVRDPRKNRDVQAVEQRIRSERLYEMAEEVGLVESKLQVPDAVMRGSEEMARGFLQALFSADGSVQGSVEKGISVRLPSVDEAFLKQVQQLLLNFGIASTVYEERREAGASELPDGRGGTKEYETQAEHELVVSSAHTVTFEDEIGFLLEHKNEAFDERLDQYSRGPYRPAFEATVESVEPDGNEAVYDLTEPDTHSFVANGIVVHNCGEQPLCEYEACNLGHINLSTVPDLEAPDWRVWYDDNGEEYADLEAAVEAFVTEAIDLEELEHRIEYGTRFLENVVTMSDFPVPEIERTVREMRKVGLGIMGLAQLYVQLGIEYGSEEGDALARQVMCHINHESKWASHELAQQRGSFEDWGDSKYADPTEYREWFEKQTGLEAEEWSDGFPIRNHNTTTIAPTGTTSMVGNTTGGCEPIYNVAYYKNVSDDVQGDEMLVEFDDYFLRTLEANDLDVAAVKEEAQEQMATNEFDGLEGLETVPDAIGELFVVTSDLSAKEHAAVQCALQEGVDSAISKTTNAPNDATLEDTREVFEYIYEHGGKGVTYYRDGTRSKQVLTTRADNAEFADDEEAAQAIVDQIHEAFGDLESFLDSEQLEAAIEEDLEDLLTVEEHRAVRPRPDTLHGVSQRIKTGYGKLYVTINEDPETGEPFEVFANIGHSGGFTNSFTEALGKVVSSALRAGVDPDEIADELEGTRSPKVAWDKGEQIQSIPDAIGTALRRYLEDEIDKGYPQQQTLTEMEDEPADGLEGGEDELAAAEPEPDGGAVGREEVAGTEDSQELIANGENPECPQCGAMSLYYSEGCKTCEACGWSEC
jgi:ribonucleoside-diphosphate reductase alpha chain